MTNLIQSSARMQAWCREAALPFWAKYGVDPAGGFFERLHFDGSPDQEAIRRVRVQCRIIYVFSHAHSLGWSKDAKKITDHVSDYLFKAALPQKNSKVALGETGCVYSLWPNGTVHDDQRDTYTHAFLLLAMAWRAHAFCDSQALQVAHNTLAFLDQSVAATNGGYLEGHPAHLPRRQNPHMHLLEAFLTLFETTNDAGYLQRARGIITLFEQYYFDTHTHTIPEYFTQNWIPCRDTGRLIEPGHLMEWSWLIRWYERLSREKLCTDYPVLLYDAAIRLGRDPATLFLIDEADKGGNAIRKTRRSWPQFEYIKANLAAAEATGDKRYEESASALIDAMLESYLNVPISGGWVDIYSSDNVAEKDFMQASTFYHIFSTVAAVAKYTTRKH